MYNNNYREIVIIIVFRTARRSEQGHVRYERMVSGLEHIKVNPPAPTKQNRQACSALSTLLNKVVYVLAENFCAPFNSLRMHCSLSPLTTEASMYPVTQFGCNARA